MHFALQDGSVSEDLKDNSDDNIVEAKDRNEDVRVNEGSIESDREKVDVSPEKNSDSEDSTTYKISDDNLKECAKLISDTKVHPDKVGQEQYGEENRDEEVRIPPSYSSTDEDVRETRNVVQRLSGSSEVADEAEEEEFSGKEEIDHLNIPRSFPLTQPESYSIPVLTSRGVSFQNVVYSDLC